MKRKRDGEPDGTGDSKADARNASDAVDSAAARPRAAAAATATAADVKAVPALAAASVAPPAGAAAAAHGPADDCEPVVVPENGAPPLRPFDFAPQQRRAHVLHVLTALVRIVPDCAALIAAYAAPRLFAVYGRRPSPTPSADLKGRAGGTRPPNAWEYVCVVYDADAMAGVLDGASARAVERDTLQHARACVAAEKSGSRTRWVYPPAGDPQLQRDAVAGELQRYNVSPVGLDWFAHNIGFTEPASPGLIALAPHFAASATASAPATGPAAAAAGAAAVQPHTTAAAAAAAAAAAEAPASASALDMSGFVVAGAGTYVRVLNLWTGACHARVSANGEPITALCVVPPLPPAARDRVVVNGPGRVIRDDGGDTVQCEVYAAARDYRDVPVLVMSTPTGTYAAPLRLVRGYASAYAAPPDTVSLAFEHTTDVLRWPTEYPPEIVVPYHLPAVRCNRHTGRCAPVAALRVPFVHLTDGGASADDGYAYQSWTHATDTYCDALRAWARTEDLAFGRAATTTILRSGGVVRWRDVLTYRPTDFTALLPAAAPADADAPPGRTVVSVSSRRVAVSNVDGLLRPTMVTLELARNDGSAPVGHRTCKSDPAGHPRVLDFQDLAAARAADADRREPDLLWSGAINDRYAVAVDGHGGVRVFDTHRRVFFRQSNGVVDADDPAIACDGQAALDAARDGHATMTADLLTAHVPAVAVWTAVGSTERVTNADAARLLAATGLHGLIATCATVVRLPVCPHCNAVGGCRHVMAVGVSGHTASPQRTAVLLIGTEQRTVRHALLSVWMPPGRCRLPVTPAGDDEADESEAELSANVEARQWEWMFDIPAPPLLAALHPPPSGNTPVAAAAVGAVNAPDDADDVGAADKGFRVSADAVGVIDADSESGWPTLVVALGGLNRIALYDMRARQWLALLPFSGLLVTDILAL